MSSTVVLIDNPAIFPETPNECAVPRI